MCSSRFPVAVTASRIARLTAGSRVRSAGSSKFSDLRTYATTRWSGRPGLASCGEDCCVSVAGAAHTRLSARLTASLSNVKSIESMLLKRWLGSCARRCVSRLPRKALLDRLAFWTYKKVSIRPVATSIARAPHALPCRALAPSPRGGSAGARVAMLALVIPRVLGMMRPVRVARTSDTFRGFRVRFAASSSSDATSVPPGRPNTDTDTIDTPTPVSTVNNASAHKGPTVKRTAGKVAPRRTAESRRTDWNGVPDDDSCSRTRTTTLISTAYTPRRRISKRRSRRWSARSARYVLNFSQIPSRLFAHTRTRRAHYLCPVTGDCLLTHMALQD